MTNIKENVKALWQYVKDCAEDEEINLRATFAVAVPGFEYDEAMMSDEAIDALSDDEARALLFDINYMAINELFDGDFETWNYTLESLGFDDETIGFLNY